MAEPATATVDSTITQITTPSEPVVKGLDLITKVAQFKKPVTTVQDNTYKDFDEITDVKAKEIAINRDKARQADYTRKTQELAQQKKEFEDFKEKSKNWTTERIQRELLENPQFLQTAQQLQGQNPPNSGLTDEQFSTLTESEKAKLAQVDSMKSQIDQLTQSNLQARINVEIAQTDAQLTNKFSDYNPVEINSATETLGKMNLSNIREYVYKATKHDEHVAAAYELGKQEALQFNKEKQSAIGLNGFETSESTGALPRNKGESDQAWMARNALNRLSQYRKK